MKFLLALLAFCATTAVVQGVPAPVADHGGSNVVVVSLFYETLCPECRNFITTQLQPTYQKLLRSGKNN